MAFTLVRTAVRLAAKVNKPLRPDSSKGPLKVVGAGNEARTRDLNLGKVALYQLSYSRTGKGRFLSPPERKSRQVRDFTSPAMARFPTLPRGVPMIRVDSPWSFELGFSAPI
jgi:hypothetical protein